jgi:p-aminobenzoyl-glutamate transporter AbgT
MTFTSIFTNFGLLYLHHTDIFEYITKDRNNIFDKKITNIYKIWVFLAAILWIIAIRFITQKMIPDKPVWIIDEEERRSFNLKKENEIEESEVKKNKD